MSRRLAPLAVLWVAACSDGPPHVVALISAPSGLTSQCVVVEMTGDDPRSPFDTVVTRDPGQDALEVAVYRQDWPETVSLEALLPASCGAPPFARLAHSPVQGVTFQPKPREVHLDIPDPSPASLAFVGSLGSQESGACSPPLELQVQDAQGAPALISSLVTASLSATPDIGLQLYIDDTCDTPVSQVAIGPAPSAAVRVRGAAAGSTVVSATAPGLNAAQTPMTVVAGPPAKVVVLSSPQTVLSGDCSAPVVLELQDAAGNPAPARANLPLTVQMPAAAPGFYSDALCLTPLGSVIIPTGSTQATLTFRPYSPGTATLTATAGALAGTQQEVTVPIVRRGTCGIPDGAASVQCAVSPPPLQRARAFAFFQATNNSSAPSDSQVRCTLANPPTFLNCFRDSTGGMLGSVTIHWSVVELAYAQVQHVSLNCGNNPPLPVSRVNLPRPVNLSQAFLLFSVASIGGDYTDDFRAGHFEDGGTSVLFENDVSDCRPDWVYNAQAVELVGATVDRGTATTDAGTIAVTGLPVVDRNRTFLLYSWGTSLSAPTNAICERMVMGEMDTDTSLLFSIGNGVAACKTRPALVAWERVQLRIGIVQSPTVTMNAGETSKSVTLGQAYNNSRTAVLGGGGQAVGGQGDGQCSYAADDMAAEGIARASLGGGTNLSLQRDSADAGAKWRPYVVEFQP